MSRTTWLVITIVGLTAFIVGGGVALLEDGNQPPAGSKALAVSASSPSSAPALELPAAPGPSVSLAEDEGHDNKGHGKAKGHQDDQGEAD